MRKFRSPSHANAKHSTKSSVATLTPTPFIYAFKRTGRIVTKSNKHRLTEKQLRQWNDAIDEYQHRVDSGKVI
jgi:hypothetical protein